MNFADLSQLYEVLLDPEYVKIETTTEGDNGENCINLLLEDTGSHSKLYIHACKEVTLTINLPRPLELHAWGMRSANDFAERNPSKIEVSIKESESGDWKLVR